MRTIYKYPLQIVEQQTLYLPKDAEILAVQEQEHDLVLWAIVDPSAPEEPRMFSVYGTGHPFLSNTALSITYGTMRYLGTAKVGKFVWHVFEGPLP